MNISKKGIDLIKKCYIYVLTDPIDNSIRYVGKTVDLKSRYRKHLNESEKPKFKKQFWIKSLLDKGLKPIIEVIDIVDFSVSGLIEQMYINQFKGWGIDLTNIQTKPLNGIETHSNASRIKISNRLKGSKQSIETIEKRRLSVTKSWECPLLRQKQRENSIKLNKLGIIGTKGNISKKRGIPLGSDVKIKISISLNEFYSKNKSSKIWNPDNIDDVIKDYLCSELSLNDLSLKYDVHRTCITNTMKRNGITLRNGSKSLSYDDLYHNLITLGLSVKDCSVKLSCSKSNIEKHQKIHNIYKNK